MSVSVIPCFSLVVARLSSAGSENFAIWVTKSPLPGGYVHHDTPWTKTMTQKWCDWQEMFSLQSELHLPILHETSSSSLVPLESSLAISAESYSGRLMQELGITLWQWLFDGSVRQSLAQSRGVALGKNQPLRLRLEIRDPNLISLPWEIMQPEAGKQSISLNPQILFSRTTSNVDPLAPQQVREELNILLVLGEPEKPSHPQENPHIMLPNDLKDKPMVETLQLEAEASNLAQVIEQGACSSATLDPFASFVPTHVKTLVQPTPAALIEALDSGIYNVFFYAGHGMPAPDGGLLFLHPNAVINGTELAQVLVRNRITLGVFNACWGAQPEQHGSQSIERSSLVEVLIHHGVPAVLGMRDSIADQEALSFICAFTKALTQRMPIDKAVTVARQQLVTLYQFNQPAWTLPILYMHPEFEGQLIQPIDEGITQLPQTTPSLNQIAYPVAYIRSLEGQAQFWRIQGGMMRVGRRQDNDLVIQEKWVSQYHAEIICRDTSTTENNPYTYFLQDFSRFGTFIYNDQGWQPVHRQEVSLTSGVQIKFGSPYGQALEFVIEGSS